MAKKTPQPKPKVFYWRVVYTTRVAGHVFRGPKAEAIVDAPTLEHAARLVKGVRSREARARFGLAGDTELIKIEPSTEAEQVAHMSDALNAMDMTTWGKAEPADNPSEAIKRVRDYEARQAAIRRARRTKPFRSAKKARGD